MAGTDIDALLAEEKKLRGKKGSTDIDSLLAEEKRNRISSQVESDLSNLNENLQKTLENQPEEGFFAKGIRNSQNRLKKEQAKGFGDKLINAVSYPQAALFEPIDNLIEDFGGSSTGIPQMFKRGQDTLTFNTWGKGAKKYLNYLKEGGIGETVDRAKGVVKDLQDPNIPLTQKLLTVGLGGINTQPSPILDKVSKASDEEYQKDTEEHPIATGVGTVGGMVIPFSTAMKALEKVPLLKKVKDAPKLLEGLKTLLRGGVANTGISQAHDFDPERAPIDFALGSAGELAGQGIGKGLEKGAAYAKEYAPKLMNYVLRTPLKLLKKGDNLGKEVIERRMGGSTKGLLKQAEEGLEGSEDTLQNVLNSFEAKPSSSVDLPSYIPEEITGAGVTPSKTTAFIDSPTLASPEDVLMADRKNQVLLQRLQQALERQSKIQGENEALQKQLEDRLLKMGGEDAASLSRGRQEQEALLNQAADVYHTPKPFEGTKTDKGIYPSRPYIEPPVEGSPFDEILASLNEGAPTPKTILRKGSLPEEEVMNSFRPTPGSTPREFIPPRERNILSPEDFIDPELSLTPKDFEPPPLPVPKGQLVDKEMMVKELQDLKKTYKGVPNRQSELETIDSYIDEVRNMEDMTPAEANRLKRKIYDLRQKSYGKDVVPVKADADMAMARGLKKSIEALAPETKGINQDLRFFGQLRDTLADKLAKTEKPDFSIRGLLQNSLGERGGSHAAVGMDRFANMINYLRMLQLQNLLTRSATQIPAAMRQGGIENGR